VQSANKPKLYDSDAANANARLSSQLPYIMATCRFAHYLKAMMRDRIGSFTSKDELQMFFNRWITQYVTTTTRQHKRPRQSTPCVKLASMWRRSRENPAPTVPWLSCVLTSNSTS